MARLPRLLRSSSYQVGTLFAALMLLGVFFVSYWLVIASDNSLLRESEEAIRADIGAFKVAEDLAGTAGVLTLLEQRISGPDTGFFYALKGRDDRLLRANIPAWPSESVERLREGTILFEIAHELLPGRDASRRIGSEHFDVMAKLHTLADGSQLLVGRDVDDLEIAQWVAEAFGWTMIAILLSIFALSYGVAYYVASRFNRIAATTQRIIQTGDLDERLIVDSSWDDLSKLSMLLNQLLEELAQRVGGIQAVTNNIAHDLRTPLMRLRTRIESEVQGDAREGLLAEVDATLRVFHSLLRISDIEAGKAPIALEPVAVDRLLADVADLYEPLIADRGLRLQCSAASLSVAGDRDLLFQALANLLDNALKFTPAGGVIELLASREDGRVALSVTDSGPGIPPADRERVLERFTRLDTSRSQPGNGLGLPLVAAITRRHGGDLVLREANPDGTGLCARLSLPAA